MRDLWIKINRIPFWVKMLGMSAIMFVFFQLGPLFSFPESINLPGASLIIIFSWFISGFFYSMWDWSIDNNKRIIGRFLIILIPLFLLLALFLMNLGLVMIIEIFSYTNHKGDLIYINNVGYIIYALIFTVTNIALVISFIVRLYKSFKH